jgi:RNA polymerase sigma-70 factor (ECF subfamily)
MAAHYPMPPTEQARWFAEEVHPHEPALRAYLQARFPNLADHDDLVQETYTRLLRAKDTGGVRYPKAFLFTAARNAAFDLFRRRRAHPTESINDRAELVVLDAQPSAAEALDQRYELEVLAEAVRALPDR